MKNLIIGLCLFSCVALGIMIVGLNIQTKTKEQETKGATQITPTTAALPIPTLIPTKEVSVTYSKPSSWKTVTLTNSGISICLPPTWKVGEFPSDIIFNRDPGYKPIAVRIYAMPYKGGSRREEFLNAKLIGDVDAAKLKSQTKVSEVFINTRSVLDISIPSFPRSLVFVSSNKLIVFDLGDWQQIESSYQAYLTKIYTMIGCIK